MKNPLPFDADCPSFIPAGAHFALTDWGALEGEGVVAAAAKTG
jgi:hypothetical protein